MTFEERRLHQELNSTLAGILDELREMRLKFVPFAELCIDALEDEKARKEAEMEMRR